MTNYARGRRKEWKVRDLFIEQGYYVVRAAGSLGYIDLIALGTSNSLFVQTICIQVKSNKFTKAEKAKMKEFRKILNPTVRLQAWVVLDGQKPKMEFEL